MTALEVYDSETALADNAMLDELTALLQDDYAAIFAPRNKATNKPVEFDLKPNQRQYLYFAHRGWIFCYTPHADTDGNYWTWTYKPIGKGARTGTAKKWRMIDRIKFAHRNKAKARAIARWNKAKQA